MSASAVVLSWPFRMIAAVFTPAHRMYEREYLRSLFGGECDEPPALWREALTLGVWRRREPEINPFEHVRTPGRPDA